MTTLLLFILLLVVVSGLFVWERRARHTFIGRQVTESGTLLLGNTTPFIEWIHKFDYFDPLTGWSNRLADCVWGASLIAILGTLALRLLAK